MPDEPTWLHPEAIDPFFVVFREANSRIEVLAIAHGRRRPGYWLGDSRRATLDACTATD